MENNLNGIRRLSLISLGYEDGFQAKPVHNYDVYISEKKYNKMLSDEKKIPLNWLKQVWQYALYLFQLAYKSISMAITAIFVILFLSFITTDPVKAINVDDLINIVVNGTQVFSFLAFIFIILFDARFRSPVNVFENEVLKKLYKKAQESNGL